MNIDIEFFDNEPIENLVTCLNFKMDKVIYFGYNDVMTVDKRRITKKSLEEICEITDVEYVEVCKDDLDEIVETLEAVIKREKANGNECFFELTGGEELELVAMGILSAKYDLPMHRFDIESGRLQTLNKNNNKRIDTLVENRSIKLNLEQIISMQGGSIDYNEQTFSRDDLEDKSFEEMTLKLWEIADINQKKWNCMSTIFKGFAGYETEETKVCIWNKKLNSLIHNAQGIDSYEEFIKYFNMLVQAGALINVHKENGKLIFMYKSWQIKECIIEAGTLLELRTYYSMKNSGSYSDYKVGVNINWDGEFNPKDDGVENEVDVMALTGYTPVFVSCKNGKVTQMALYELETVANRFGGKYAKKVMMASQGLTPGYSKRAAEMGILEMSVDELY